MAKKKNPREGVANWKNKNYWAVKRFAKAFASAGFQLDLCESKNDSEEVTAEISFSAVYTIGFCPNWFLEVFFLPRIIGKVCEDDGKMTPARAFDIAVYYYYGDIDRRDDCDCTYFIVDAKGITEKELYSVKTYRNIFDALEFIFSEPELAWYRAETGIDYNIHYITRRAAKKAYRKYLKDKKKSDKFFDHIEALNEAEEARYIGDFKDESEDE